MPEETFEEFRSALFARHEAPMTSLLGTVGDAVQLVAIVGGAVRRDARLAVGGYLVGLAVTTVAHLFQPGTLKDEVVALASHPGWGFRAEVARVFGRPARLASPA